MEISSLTSCFNESASIDIQESILNDFERVHTKRQRRVLKLYERVLLVTFRRISMIIRFQLKERVFLEHVQTRILRNRSCL